MAIKKIKLSGSATAIDIEVDWANVSNTPSLTPLDSPAFIGTPTAPTATANTNTTQLATTAFVQTAVSNKLDTNLGSANAGKFLVVGDDGNIVLLNVAYAAGVSF